MAKVNSTPSARQLILYLYLAAHVLSCSTSTLSEAAVTNYTTGPFTIAYDSLHFPTVSVFQDEKLVWFTSRTDTDGFVAAAQVTEDVKQNGGIYILNFSTNKKCTEMHLDDVVSTPSNSAIYRYPIFSFHGTLCSTTHFKLTFQAVGVEDSSKALAGVTYTHLRFNLTLAEDTAQYNQLWLKYGCEKDENLYGFGAQYSKFNMKGQRLPVFLSEKGVGRGVQPLTYLLEKISPGSSGKWYTTYTHVPHYITNYHRSLMLESLEYAIFDMTSDDSITIELNSKVLTGRIITGNSLLDLISSYTAFVGRMRPLPKWVGTGAVLGLQGGTAAVNATLGQVEREWGNMSDVAAVWLQDWTGQRNFSGKNDLARVGLWWNWEVDTTHYPDWTQFISYLASKEIRTLTYINCLFSNVSLRGTPYQHNYYKEGLEKNYFAKNGDGSVWTGYSESSIADLSNYDAYKWMVNMIVKNMLGTGVCGWMCDFGESIPLNADLKYGEDGQYFHSLYPSLWGQLNQDAIAVASTFLANSTLCNADDVVYFMRSGNAHSPAATRLFWLGDQLVTWDSHDGVATVVIAMLSEGLSGYSLTHSDIGGYTAIHKSIIKYVRTKELFLRWCELAAFTAMYRSHLGTLPDENWQFNSDGESLQHFFKMAVVFQSWDFYRQELMQTAYESGWPLARHMMLVFKDLPSDSEEELKYQFMVGTHLLVAPVLTKGANSVRVFLPVNTEWMHVWSGQNYKGNNAFVEIAAPIGQPCVLYPAGSQVGKQLVQNLKDRKLLM